MDKNKIEEYIDNGLELDLLDKLNSYVISNFDNRTKNVIAILIIIQEKSEIHMMKANQALISLITEVLPEILGNTDYLNQFISVLKENAVKPYTKISFLIRQFIIGIEDKDEKLFKAGNTVDQLKVIQEELLKVNIHFLQESINDKCSFNDIITVFYNCVNRLEAERKTIIDDRAIEIFRDYLNAFPEEYLKSFIRPYYSGGINSNHREYFLHVAEPFYNQIFTSKDLFHKFLEDVKTKVTDKELISDLENFYIALQNKPLIDGNKYLMLKNPFKPDGLELKSRNHINVRT